MSQKRRTFLKSLGLAGLAGFTLDVDALQAAPKVPAKDKDLLTISLSGKVQAQGKGIAGVAVTDGTNITLTDAKGNYALESNAAAEFVYITIARGYEFTTKMALPDSTRR